MAEPKRRYKADLGLQAAQRSLDQIVGAGFETLIREKELESAKEEKFLTLALQDELAAQSKYTDFLLDQGVNLGEQYRSSAYSTIVENATGDIGSLEMLNTALDGVREKNIELKSMYADFISGQKMAQSGEFSEFSNLVPSKPGTVGTVQFSGEEFDQIFAMEKFEDRLEGKDLDIFKQGFLAGNMDQASALKYMETENNLYNSRLNTANGQFAMAESLGVKALNNIENDVMSLIDSKVPVSNLLMYAKSDNDDAFESYQDGIESIIKGEDYGLSKNGYVAKLLASTVRNASMEDAKSPIYSFAKLSASAKEELINFQTTARQYSKDSSEYKSLEIVMKDFQKLGLIQSTPQGYQLTSTAVQAVEGLQNMDDLFESMGSYSESLLAEMSDRGMVTPDFNLSYGDVANYSEPLNEDQINQELNNFLMSRNLDEDPLLEAENTSNVFEVGGISFNKELNEANKALDKINETEQMIKDYDADVAKESQLKNSVTAAFKGLQNSIGMKFDSEIPTYQDIEKLKENYIDEMNLSRGMSDQDRALAQQKIIAFNRFIEIYNQYRNIAGQTTSGDRNFDIERMLIEEGLLSPEALAGPQIGGPIYGQYREEDFDIVMGKMLRK